MTAFVFDAEKVKRKQSLDEIEPRVHFRLEDGSLLEVSAHADGGLMIRNLGQSPKGQLAVVPFGTSSVAVFPVDLSKSL